MPIETHAPASTTPSLLDIIEQMNQAETPDDFSVWFADGRESLAASLDAALLQREWMEEAGRLFFEPATVIRIHSHLGTNMFPVLLDVSCLDLTTSQEAVVDDRGQQRLASKLRASFEENPFEDGMGHSAEGIIAEALRSVSNQQVLDWLRGFLHR